MFVCKLIFAQIRTNSAEQVFDGFCLLLAHQKPLQILTKLCIFIL